MSETLGQRLLDLRKRRRISQRVLADASGVHVDVIRKLEQGQRDSARLETVTALAGALSAPVSELLGVAPGLPGRQQADVVALRAAIYDDRAPTIDEPPAVDELRTAVGDLWQLYWAGRFEQLAGALPDRLTAARVVAGTVPAAERRAASAVLAELLQLSASLAAHLTYEDLAHVALLQATTAAEDADDPLLRAVQQATRAWVLSRQGLWPQAERLVAASASEVEPTLSRATPEEIAVWGDLLHFGTIALARDKREHEARELLALVQAAGAAIGNRRPRYTSMLQFGPTFAGTSAVATAMAVGQPREALQLAERVENVDTLPLSIRSRFLLNVAYAQAVEWRSLDAVNTLRQVDGLTPELLERHGLARATIEELLPRRRKQRLPGLARLAERLDIAVA